MTRSPEAQSAADLICGMWQRAISEIEDPRIDDASVMVLVNGTRKALRDVGCSQQEEHALMELLRDLLPALTKGHPICKQFIEALDRELSLEFN
jgi:hypothetical protein